MSTKYKIGDQFIITITGFGISETTGETLYECDQFTENSFMEEEEVDRLIKVDEGTRTFTNGYQVGFKDGFDMALKRCSNWMVEMFGGSSESEEMTDDWKTLPIDSVGLKVRTSNCLINSGIKTLDDLCSFTRNEIFGLRFMGKRGVADIDKVLSKRGLHLKGE